MAILRIINLFSHQLERDAIFPVQILMLLEDSLVRVPKCEAIFGTGYEALHV